MKIICTIKFINEELSDKCFLTKDEIKVNSMKLKGQNEYLSVRHFIKFILNEGEPEKISILNDKLGAPYIVGNEAYNLSISHSKDMIFILLIDKKYNVGIDIQYISEYKIESYIDAESNKYTLNNEEKIRLMSIKESLGKFLKIGLLGEKNIYEVSEIEYINESTVKYTFKNFRFLTGYSLKVNREYIASFVTIKDYSMEKNIMEEISKNINEGIT